MGALVHLNRIFLVFILFTLVRAPFASAATIAFVQAANNYNGLTATFATPTTKGNSIICIFSPSATGETSTLSLADDAAGGSNYYSLAVRSKGSGFDYQEAILYSLQAKPASNVTMTTDVSATLGCYEFSNIGAYDPAVSIGSGFQTLLTSGVGSLGPINVSTNNELIITTAITSGTQTTPAGFTPLDGGDRVNFKIVNAGSMTIPFQQTNNSYDLFQAGVAGFIAKDAACSSPLGVPGQFHYDTVSNKLYLCNGATWIPMTGNGGTVSACTAPDTGKFYYTGSTYAFCNGTNWLDMKGYAANTCSASLSKHLTFDPNLNAAKFCNGTNWYGVTPAFSTPSAWPSVYDDMSGGTAVTTYTSAHVAGHTLIAYVNPYNNGNWSGTSALSLSDTAGNTWWGLPPVYDGSGNYTQMFYASNINASSGNTITATDPLNNLKGMNITISEFDGLPASNPLDVVSNASGATNGTSNISVGPLTAGKTDTFVMGSWSGNGTPLPIGPLRRGSNSSSVDLATNAPETIQAGSSFTGTVTPWGAAWLATLAGFRSNGTAAPSVPTKIVISSSAVNANSYTCQPITYQSQNVSSIATMMQINSKITPTASGATFFADANCTINITYATLWAGQTSLTIYGQFATPGTITLSTSVTNGLTAPSNQTETIADNPGRWIGGNGAWSTAANWRGGSVPTASTDVVFEDTGCPTCTVTLPNSAVSVKSIHDLTSTGFSINWGGTSSSVTTTGDVLLCCGGGTKVFNGLNVGGTFYSWAGTTLLGCSDSSCSAVGSGLTSTLNNVYGGFTMKSPVTVTGSIFRDGNISNNSTITFTGTSVLLDSIFWGGEVVQGNVVYNHAGGTMQMGWVDIGNFTVTAGSVVDVGNNTMKFNSLTMAAGTTLTSMSDYFQVVTTTSAPSATITLGHGGEFGGNSNIGTLSATSGDQYQNTLSFGAGTTQTIGTGGLNLYGSINNNFLLRSLTTGTQFTITPAKAYTVGPYLDVMDSKKGGSFTVHSGANFVNSGNNTGWLFP